MKNFAHYAFTAVAVVSLSSVAYPSLAAGKKVAWFDTGPTHPYVAALNNALKSRAAELGLEVTQFDNVYDPGLQAQQVDDAIARNFDILAIMPASEKGIVPALQRAKEAGVPVVIVNNGVVAGVEDLYVTSVAEDNKKLGAIAAASVIKAIKASGRNGAKIALVTGALSGGVARDRLDGFTAAATGEPGFEIIETEDAFWDTAKSEEVAGQLFLKYAARGGLDVVVTWADNQSAAVVRAAKAAGLQLGAEQGKVLVVGISCDPNGIRLIKSGEQYSTGLQSPMRTGKRAAEALADTLAKKQLPKFDELPSLTIDSSNVDAHVEACTY